MAFKSYSWAIGTTSFRTSQLNYKIERQLQLLKEFWSNNSTKKWTDSIDDKTKLKLTKDEKKPTQVEYYEFLKENNFLTGDASIRDKDAREKTSGLVDIGVLTEDRKLTEVGSCIEGLLNKEKNKNNIFLIDEDSYYYLLQFLKLQVTDGGLKIRPFIALIYMIEKLGYLSYDEFTYLLPLCKNKYDVKQMVRIIEENRQGVDIDTIITTKIYDMPNYLEAWMKFRQDYPVTEETFEEIGMNRKSRAYDRPYNALYHILVDLVFHLKHNSFEERLEKYNELYESCKRLSGKAQKLWNEYLFFGYKPNNFDDEFKYAFLSVSRSYLINMDDNEIFTYVLNKNYKDSPTIKKVLEISREYDSITSKMLLDKIIEVFDFYGKLALVGNISDACIRIEYLQNMQSTQ